MFEEPAQGDDWAGGTAGARDQVEGFADVNAAGVIRVAKIDGVIGAEAACGQWAPSHRSHLVSHAMFDGAILEAIEFGKADFDLIDDEGHGAGLLQGGNLVGMKITDPEFTDFSGLFEAGKSVGDFLGIGEIIRSMKLVEVDGVGFEAAEGLFAGPDDMAGGEIVAVGGVRIWVAGAADAALGGDEDLFAHAGDFFEDLTENAFAFAVGIDIRVIEEGITGFVGGNDGLMGMSEAFGRDFGRVA